MTTALAFRGFRQAVRASKGERTAPHHQQQLTAAKGLDMDAIDLTDSPTIAAKPEPEPSSGDEPVSHPKSGAAGWP